MRHSGLPPDVLFSSALISACEQGQQWQRALGTFKHGDAGTHNVVKNVECIVLPILAGSSGCAYAPTACRVSEANGLGAALLPGLSGFLGLLLMRFFQSDGMA